MSPMPSHLFQTWSHSFEEDAEGVTVFRPADFAFPPARGREAIEFRANGGFTDWPLGPADVPTAIGGHWREEGAGSLKIAFENDVLPSRVLEIVHCDEEVLRVRRR